MKQLESHPMFNPAIKVVDVPQKEKKMLPVAEDKDDLSFNLFEQPEKDPPAEKGSSHKWTHTEPSWINLSTVWTYTREVLTTILLNQILYMEIWWSCHFTSFSFIAVKKNQPKDIRNFDYTARSWTGKSPKQFLIDWVRKNLPKSRPPAFHKVAAGRYWRCK